MRIGVSARISGPGLDASEGLLGEARHAHEHGLEFWTAVYASLPITVTADPAAARETAAAEYGWYGTVPSYRAMLDREGAQGPGDVAVVGDEETVAAQLHRLFETGATGFRASVFGTAEERRRTYALLSELAKA